MVATVGCGCQFWYDLQNIQMANKNPTSTLAGLSRQAALVRRRQSVVFGAALLGLAAIGVGADFGIRSIWPRSLGMGGRLTSPRNVLVVGLDRSGKISAGNLFVVAHLDPRGDRVTLLSLPARTQTTIVGYGVSSLAQAPALGGLRLAKQAAQELIGAPVDAAIALPPAAEAALVDAVGGLEVFVPTARGVGGTAGKQELMIPAGDQHMDGTMAAAYASAPPDGTGDLGRVTRQQFLIWALARQIGDRGTRIAAVTHVLDRAATGDVQPSALSALSGFLASHPDLEFATLPGDAGFDGAWIPNPLRISALMKKIARVGPARTSSAPLAEILFDPLKDKQASKLANELEDSGMTVVRTAPLRHQQPTSIVSRRGNRKLDGAVRALLPGAPWFLSDDPSPYSADYTFTIGSSW